jgi:hypothetical protein
MTTNDGNVGIGNENPNLNSTALLPLSWEYFNTPKRYAFINEDATDGNMRFSYGATIPVSKDSINKTLARDEFHRETQVSCKLLRRYDVRYARTDRGSLE